MAMEMKMNLNLKMSQKLVMTPMLQQAIKLLQLTNLELTEFVESQLEENPFLEREETEPGEEGNVSLDSGRDELTPGFSRRRRVRRRGRSAPRR